MLDEYEVFDCHLHIIDRAYPLVPNNGYLPDDFSHLDYLARMRDYRLCGGAVVSGSFQAFDQSYLKAALQQLGPSFVGVTQLPDSVSDDDILDLDRCGVRAVRYNLRRGGSGDVRHLLSFGSRVHELAAWHVELYVDSAALAGLYRTLIKLPSLSIDHLGLNATGFDTVLQLAEKGVRVKATGFGRVDFPVAQALRDLYAANPAALMFGSDLPSTRAPRPYDDEDFRLVAEVLGAGGARAVFSANALAFYQPGRRAAV